VWDFVDVLFVLLATSVALFWKLWDDIVGMKKTFIRLYFVLRYTSLERTVPAKFIRMGAVWSADHHKLTSQAW